MDYSLTPFSKTPNGRGNDISPAEALRQLVNPRTHTIDMYRIFGGIGFNLQSYPKYREPRHPAWNIVEALSMPGRYDETPLPLDQVLDKGRLLSGPARYIHTSHAVGYAYHSDEAMMLTRYAGLHKRMLDGSVLISLCSGSAENDAKILRTSKAKPALYVPWDIEGENHAHMYREMSGIMPRHSIFPVTEEFKPDSTKWIVPDKQFDAVSKALPTLGTGERDLLHALKFDRPPTVTMILGTATNFVLKDLLSWHENNLPPTDVFEITHNLYTNYEDVCARYEANEAAAGNPGRRHIHQQILNGIAYHCLNINSAIDVREYGVENTVTERHDGAIVEFKVGVKDDWDRTVQSLHPIHLKRIPTLREEYLKCGWDIAEEMSPEPDKKRPQTVVGHVVGQYNHMRHIKKKLGL